MVRNKIKRRTWLRVLNQLALHEGSKAHFWVDKKPGYCLVAYAHIFNKLEFLLVQIPKPVLNFAVLRLLDSIVHGKRPTADNQPFSGVSHFGFNNLLFKLAGNIFKTGRAERLEEWFERGFENFKKALRVVI